MISLKNHDPDIKTICNLIPYSNYLYGFRDVIKKDGTLIKQMHACLYWFDFLKIWDHRFK